MSKQSHTPGPWHVSELNAAGNVDPYSIFIEPNIAVIERKVAGQDQNDMADASLIAAALTYWPNSRRQSITNNRPSLKVACTHSPIRLLRTGPVSVS